MRCFSIDPPPSYELPEMSTWAAQVTDPDELPARNTQRHSHNRGTHPLATRRPRSGLTRHPHGRPLPSRAQPFSGASAHPPTAMTRFRCGEPARAYHHQTPDAPVRSAFTLLPRSLERKQAPRAWD